MGEVWLGRHELLGRNVAVKFLTRAVIDKKGPGIQNISRRARVAASLEHPGLNKVYDADVEGGVPYLFWSFWMGRTSPNWLNARGLWIFRRAGRYRGSRGAVAELNSGTWFIAISNLQTSY